MEGTQGSMVCDEIREVCYLVCERTHDLGSRVGLPEASLSYHRTHLVSPELTAEDSH